MASILFWLDTAAHGLIAMVAGSLFVLVVSRRDRGALNVATSLLMAAISLWAGSSAALRFSLWLNWRTLQFWAELSTLGIMLVGPLLLLFSYINVQASRRWSPVLSAAALVFTGLVCVLLFSQQIIADVYVETAWIVRWDWTLLGDGLSILVSGCAFLALALLASRYRVLHKSRPLFPIAILIASALLFSFLMLPFPALSSAALVFVSMAGYGVQARDLLEHLRKTAQGPEALGMLPQGIAVSAGGGTLVYNDAGCITFASPGISRLLGYPQRELIGQHWTTMVATEQAPAFAREAERQRQGAASTYETVLLTREGRPMPVTVDARPLLDDKRLGYALAVSPPTSEHTHGAELLQKESEAFDNVLHRTAYGVLVADQSGRCLYVNPEFTNIVGYALKDIPTLSDWLHRVWPDAERRREFAKAWRRDSAQQIGRVFEIRCKDGDHKKVRFESIVLDDNRIIFVLSDVGESERLLAALQRRGAQLRTSAEVSKSASVVLEPEKLMSQTVRLIQERFAFDYVGLFLVDATGEVAVLQADAGVSEHHILEESCRVRIDGESGIGWSIVNAEPCVTLRLGKEKVRFDRLGFPDPRSEMVLPLLARGMCIGALAVQSARDGAFEEVDAAVLQSMADHLAIAIQNARLYTEARARSRYLEALLKITTALRDALPLSSVLEAIAQAACQALDCAGSAIAIPDRSQERLILGAVSGDRVLETAAKLAGVKMESYSVPLSAEENPVVQAYLSGETLAWNMKPESIATGVEPPLLPRFSPVIAETPGSRLASCIPLPVGERVFGVLVAFSPRGELTEEGQAVLMGLADQAGLAIANSYLSKAFRQELIERDRLNQQVRKRRLYLESVLDCAPDAIVTLDSRHNILEWNSGAEKLFGYSRDEVLARNLDDMIASPDPKAFEEASGFSRLMLRGKRVPPTETVRFRKDGSPVEVILAGAPIVAQGELVGAVAVYTGIAELRQAQEALRESETKYRTLFESAPCLIALMDRDGTITDCNRVTSQVSGQTREAMLGRHYADLGMLDEDGLVQLEAALARLLDGEAPHSFEVRTKSESGESHWLEIRPVLLRKGNSVSAVQIVAHDITERRRAEQALRRSELQYRTTLDAMGDAIHVVDRNLRFTLFNAAFEEWNRELGLETDAIGRELFEVFPFLPEKVRDEYRQVFDTGEVLFTEDTTIIGERSLTTETRKIPIFHDGNATQVVTVIRDITERKRTEQALRESEEKFRTVAEQSPNMIFINKQGRVVYANKRCEEVMGYARDEFYAQDFDFLALVSPDHRELVEGSFARHTVGKEVAPYGYSLITRDGSMVDAILSTRLIPYEGDSAILGTITDVSELKRAEIVLQRRNRELELLNRVGRAFGSTLDLDRILTIVLEETRQTLNATGCSVWLVDPESMELVCRQATGPENEKVRGWRLAPGEGIAGWVASTGDSLNVPDVRTNGRHFAGVDRQTGLELRSILSVPLRHRDEVLGVLQVVDSEADRFDDTDLALLEPLAATAAAAIENARLYEQARQDAAIKSVLLQEVNHRVKNNLSAIIGLLRASQRRADPDLHPGFENALGELTNLVQGLATVHDLLSASEWSPLLLNELADKIIRSSLRTLSQGERVDVDVASSSVRVTPDQAHNLTLIINELTTNAVKHALAGRERVQVTVSIGLKGEVVLFEFRDDGPGYSEEALQLKPTCIGLDLVQKITRRSLHGHLSLRNDRGAVTAIRFRARAEKAGESSE